MYWPCYSHLWISLTAFSILNLLHRSDALQIDNEVVGIPQIRCSENAITFSLRSRNLFRGNIYIKGNFQLPQCRQEYFSNDYNGASFTVRIGECGMRRIRQLSPNGINYMLVFVANFHPQFVTKIDRAYNVRCFYAQIDKTVASQLEVSMLSTLSLEDSTMLLPQCEYTVRSGSLNGPIVRFARVGDRLVHRWECNNPNYGMLVKNCFVQDGAGSSIRVLDARGCPVFTPVIQGPLQYDNSLNLAYVEIWAYKFPDRSSLFFQCQIQVCNKRENECVGLTPPNCPRVLKSDFQANSVEIPGDPTRVISTGSSSGRSGGTGGALTQVGGYKASLEGQGASSGNSVASQSISQQTGYQSGTGGRVVGSSGQLTSGGQDYRLAAVQRRVQQSQSSNLQQPFGLRAVKDFRRAKDDPVSNEVADANSSREKRNIRVKRQKAIEIDVYSPYPAANTRYDIPVDNNFVSQEDLELAGENSDNILDVSSETVYVAEVEEDPDNSDGYTHFPFTTKEESTMSSMHSQTGVCLNPLAIGLLLSGFAFCLVIIGVLLFYIITFKSKTTQTAPQQYQQKSASNSTGSSPHPISDSNSEGSSPSPVIGSRRNFGSSILEAPSRGSRRSILPLADKKWGLPSRVLKGAETEKC